MLAGVKDVVSQATLEVCISFNRNLSLCNRESNPQSVSQPRSCFHRRRACCTDSFCLWYTMYTEDPYLLNLLNKIYPDLFEGLSTLPPAGASDSRTSPGSSHRLSSLLHGIVLVNYLPSVLPQCSIMGEETRHWHHALLSPLPQWVGLSTKFQFVYRFLKPPSAISLQSHLIPLRMLPRGARFSSMAHL